MARYEYIAAMGNSFTKGKIYETNDDGYITKDDDNDDRYCNPADEPYLFKLVTETKPSSANNHLIEFAATVLSFMQHATDDDINSNFATTEDMHSPNSFKLFERSSGEVYTITITTGD